MHCLLVAEILDLAEYWARTTCYFQRSTEMSSNLRDSERSTEFNFKQDTI